MTDNTTLNVGTGGDVVATDDIGGVKHQRVKVQHGADGSATDASAASPFPVEEQNPHEFLWEVRFGNETGLSLYNLRGHAPAMGSTLQSFWSEALTLINDDIDTTPATVKLSSTSAADTSAGTGARTVLVTGLDAVGAAQTESVTMNGVTEVVTSSTWMGVNRLTVTTAGSGGSNAGTIWCGNGTVDVAGIPDDKHHLIDAGDNTSHTGIYTVPAGKTAYLQQITIFTADTSKTISTKIVVNNGTLKYTIAHLPLGTGEVSVQPVAAAALLAGYTIQFEGNTTQSTADVSLLVSILLVDD